MCLVGLLQVFKVALNGYPRCMSCLGEGVVFHKPNFYKIYVHRAVAYPLRVVVLSFAIFFTVSFYMGIETGDITARMGNTYNVADEPVLYFLAMISEFMICLFLYYVGLYAIRAKKID